MFSKIPLSAVIITHNEAGRIRACLESVAFADDIVVVDSGSDDGTPDIARQCGARVFHHDWPGFGKQKQYAVSCAAHDWVLCLDADERVSPALRADIEEALRDSSRTAWRFPRCNRFLGRWLRHGEGYPDLSLRLFHRGHARWSGDAVHEKVLCDNAPGTLSGDLLHESGETLAGYLEKQNRYTTLQAQALFAAGARAGIGRLLFSPWLRFIKFYFLRLGLLDGVPGLVHILIGCGNSFVKYAKLIELNQSKNFNEE